MDRRNFLSQILVACVAPAFVPVDRLMRIKPLVLPNEIGWMPIPTAQAHIRAFVQTRRGRKVDLKQGYSPIDGDTFVCELRDKLGNVMRYDCPDIGPEGAGVAWMRFYDSLQAGDGSLHLGCPPPGVVTPRDSVSFYNARRPVVLAERRKADPSRGVKEARSRLQVMPGRWGAPPSDF